MLAAGLMLASQATDVRAETLQEALASAYAENPTLQARRAQLRATDEGVPEARSGWRPTVSATGDAGVAETDSAVTPGGSETQNPLTYGLSVQQPLYRGGRTVAAVSRAKNLVLAERQLLRSVEQDTLFAAATTYMNVLRDTAVVELNVKTEQVLRRELDATRDRAAVGDATRTDVAQAEARLAGAVAGRIQAVGNLETTRAEYRRVIGHPPQDLQRPPPAEGLPRSMDEAQRLAEEGNPDILSAMYLERAAQDDVRLARGELLPTLSLNGDIEHREDTVTSGTETDSASIIAQLSIPLYQAGGPSARVRRAKQVANQRRLELDEARRTVRDETTQSWEALGTARARITQLETQVRANQIALDGTREQARVGSRILLDVLNAEQELLDAQVNLVSAVSEELVAELRVLSAIGRLTARDLGLQVEYFDDEAYFNQVKGKFWGTGIGGSE